MFFARLGIACSALTRRSIKYVGDLDSFSLIHPSPEMAVPDTDKVIERIAPGRVRRSR
jgi:hypothetical protein